MWENDWIFFFFKWGYEGKFSYVDCFESNHRGVDRSFRSPDPPLIWIITIIASFTVLVHVKFIVPESCFINSTMPSALCISTLPRSHRFFENSLLKTLLWTTKNLPAWNVLACLIYALCNFVSFVGIMYSQCGTSVQFITFFIENSFS